MTSMESRPVTERFITRGTTEPQSPADGHMWVNPAGGANGNNRERYVYAYDKGVWELEQAVGPDNPLYDSPGALWRDTAAGQQKVYDGGWQQIGSMGPQWEEDGNSPLVVTGAASGSYVLSGEYDQVKVIVARVDTTAGTADEVSMQINGIASGYDLMMSDGSTTVGSSQVNRVAYLVDGGRGMTGEIHMDGRWNDGFAAQLDIGTHAGYKCISATNDGAVGPLTDFSFSAANAFDLTAHVFGRTI